MREPGHSALYPVRDLAPIGAQDSSISDDVRRKAEHVGIGTSPDAVPKQAIFTRCDQYTLMSMGVPSVMFFNGIQSGEGQRSGSQVVNDWLAHVHHTPRDTLDQRIDWDTGAAYTRMISGLAIRSRTTRKARVGTAATCSFRSND